MIVEHAPKTQEVDYDDGQHKYFLGSRVYRSATQLIERFTVPFDTEERSRYMADRYGQSPDYWRTKWKNDNLKSLDRGNVIHQLREDLLHGRGYGSVGEYGRVFRVFNIEAPTYRALKANYANLPDGIYPELKLWNHSWGIAGRVDKPIIYTVGEHKFADIEDYKTNKKIDRESYHDARTGYRMMLGPLSHIMDCNYYHYALQMSIYQFMLEYFGFKPGNRRLIHIPHFNEDLNIQPKPVIIPVPYMKREVLDMLTHLKADGWLN
jgi:hypothetical protein